MNMEIQNFLKFDEIDPNKITGILKQYYNIKIQYMEYIVLFRAGDFYETYFDDAIKFSNVSSLTLTRKKFKDQKNVLMAGVSNKNVKYHIDKLLKNNYKVVLVDEGENKNEDGLLARKVSKIYTKGTLFEAEFLIPNENNYIASISKNNNGYDFSYADVSVGKIFKTKGCIDEIIFELSRIQPKELLIRKNSDIDFKIYSHFKYELLDERFYNNDNKNFAYSGILNYSKEILMEFIPEFEEVIEYNIKDYLQIDYLTRKNLELLKNSYNNEMYGSLLWALDKCKTPMGKRLLASFVSSPLFCMEEIEKRFCLIEQFLKHPEIPEKLKLILDTIGDISRISSKLSNKTATPLEFLTLKESFREIEEINSIIKKINSPIFENNLPIDLLSDFYELLNNTIEDDIDLIKKGKYIKNGANSDVDLLLIEKNNIKKEIEDYEIGLREYTKNPNLKILKKSGSYFIEIPIKSSELAGLDFRLIQELKNSKRYTTAKLMSIEEKYYSTAAKIEEAQKSVFLNLKSTAKELTGKIRRFSYNIALLDVFCSLYSCAAEYDFTCPKISPFSKSFEITEGRHITAQKLFGAFCPMDFSFDNSNLAILTGANGSGKSTLLKLIGTIVILAQIGSFVPSKKAEFPLVDKLFGIFNVSDNLSSKKSSHEAQMHEVAKIINLADEKSLILFDEIGKNTSYKDGISILFGIIKYLSEENCSKSVFSTHYQNIKSLLDDINDKILYLEIDDTRKVKKGVSLDSRGIETLVSENLPDKLIHYAKTALGTFS